MQHKYFLQFNFSESARGKGTLEESPQKQSKEALENPSRLKGNPVTAGFFIFFKHHKTQQQQIAFLS